MRNSRHQSQHERLFQNRANELRTATQVNKSQKGSHN